MKRAAWLVALSALVLLAMWPLRPTARLAGSHGRGTRTVPESDLPRHRGVRSIWATQASIESQLRRDDRVVEVVSPGRRVFIHPLIPSPAPPRESRLERAARRATIVVELTITDLESEDLEARFGSTFLWQQPSPRFTTRRVFARVERVLKNTSRRPLLPGSGIVFSYEGGGESTVAGITVATREEQERLPRRGRRYLWILHATRSQIYGGGATNAFDLTGPRLVPLFRDAEWQALNRMTVGEALALVRRSATLPEDYDVPAGTRRGEVTHYMKARW